MQKNPIKRALCALMCIVFCVLGCTLPAHALGDARTVPASVCAGAAILIEADSGRVLYEQHAHTR
ncbi:MAG: D-alanyl-D-alanine carboxypeptidase, partial [Clostridia bacterium]|nr:D-alanyl-D-alanine carboxypeptidase [Clostridia bacterium]